MVRKRFWLNLNESVAYGHPKINQFRNQDIVGVYVNLNKKNLELIIIVMKIIILLATSLNLNLK